MIRLLGVLLPLCLLAFQTASGQGEWEMRVCADPGDFPISSQDETGYENRIAEILANELRADLSYVWTRIDGQAVRRYLREGECDLMFGVAEDALGLLNTVPYYRTPYVFLYRADSGLEIHSLDDEVLADLRIGTYPNSVPHNVLGNHGLDDNAVLLPPVGLRSSLERSASILEALMSGEIDVAILYGPVAGHIARQNPGELVISPVTPEIEPPFVLMFRVWTIGVRPGDEALRDRLNIALAKRWDDIQGVFAEYGVPLQPVPRPGVPDQER